MTYIDIYEILSFQNKLFTIYENVIHFCKNIQKKIQCIGNSINRRFNSQTLETGNLNIKFKFILFQKLIIILTLNITSK